MFFGAVGDLHGDFDALDRVMARHPEVAFWVCPGDLAAEDGTYPHPRAALYWIKGNNEDFDFVAAQPSGAGTLPNLHYIPNGTSVQTHGFVLAGLGGTLAPTWYESRAADLPSHTAKPRSGAGRGAPPFEQPQGVPSESRGTHAKRLERGEGHPRLKTTSDGILYTRRLTRARRCRVSTSFFRTKRRVHFHCRASEMQVRLRLMRYYRPCVHACICSGIITSTAWPSASAFHLSRSTGYPSRTSCSTARPLLTNG